MKTEWELTIKIPTSPQGPRILAGWANMATGWRGNQSTGIILSEFYCFLHHHPFLYLPMMNESGPHHSTFGPLERRWLGSVILPRGLNQIVPKSGISHSRASCRSPHLQGISVDVGFNEPERPLPSECLSPSEFKYWCLSPNMVWKTGLSLWGQSLCEWDQIQ